MEPDDRARERHALVRHLEGVGYVRSPAVREALLAVPRELFVPEEAARDAYRDDPLLIGEGQTISAPHMVAIMAEALDAGPGDRVLEVGGGSGYHAAVYARLVAPGGHVTSVERLPALAKRAEEALGRAGLSDLVSVVVGDGSAGLPEAAPFDRVSVACAAPAVPAPLVEQLAPGGSLLVPVGSPEGQDLLRVTKREGGAVWTENLGGCRFVPLIGAHGFPADLRWENGREA